MNLIENPTVILGVTGSIAAYKMADVASELTKRGFNTQVILTENAAKIIRPITFSTLTGNKCITDTFDENVNYNVAHVSLAKRASVLLVAPATANIIAKLAYGLADDMLTTTALACFCTKMIAPAMNTNMYENPVVQRNIERLRQEGWEVIEPDTGVLACKDTGKGKLPKPELLVKHILRAAGCEKDLTGKKVLITAGPTCEPIDPVRYITNHSSGKMGYALAENAARRGAQVTLVSGPTALEAFPGVELVPIKTAEDMFLAVTSRAAEQDIILKAAAVADFTPTATSEHKIKKADGLGSITLEPTKDILAELGKSRRDDQFICGFAMETRDLLENGRKKLDSKHADMICANSLNTKGAGFMGDTNIITLITKTGETTLPLLSKDETAARIFDRILEELESR